MNGRVSFACVLCVSCFSLLAKAEAEALADSPAIELEYSAPERCPRAREFQAVVVGRLGYDPFRSSAPQSVVVRVEESAKNLEGHLEWRDAAGKWVGDRTFPSRSNDCRELVSAVGFALAVQIQLWAIESQEAKELARPAESTPQAQPTQPARPPARRVALPASPPRARSSASPDFWLGVGAASVWGVAAHPTLLGRLFAAEAWTHLSIEFGLEASLPSTTRRADGAGFSQSLLFASSALCGGVPWGKACLLAKGGRVRTQGKDIDVPATSSSALFETGLRLRLAQRVGQNLELAAQADGLVNWTQWTVRLDHAPVWSAPRYAAALGIDAAVRFP